LATSSSRLAPTPDQIAAGKAILQFMHQVGKIVAYQNCPDTSVALSTRSGSCF
jgi:hypothetical protein